MNSKRKFIRRRLFAATRIFAKSGKVLSGSPRR